MNRGVRREALCGREGAACTFTVIEDKWRGEGELHLVVETNSCSFRCRKGDKI